MTAVPTTETVIKTVSRDLTGRRFIVAKFGLRKLDGNPQAYWTATADIYEPHGTWSGRARFNNDREPDSSGSGGETIVKAWPWLAPIVALALSSADGMPMHAVENGRYWLRERPEQAAQLWRCSVDELPQPEDVETFVEAQRERWGREASEAWTILVGLS